MTKDYERYRRQLEKRLRADVELLYAASCAKLRAFEVVHGIRSGTDGDFLLSAEVPLLLLPAPLPAAVPAPAASAVPPAPRRRVKSGPRELYLGIAEALPRLPEVFASDDIRQALGYTPRRASLHHVLRDLVLEGRIAVAEAGRGRNPTRYRRL
jgi:hypothetical protein